MFRSIRNWFKRRFTSADRFHARGVPQPVGRIDQPASIWVAWSLDCTVLGYLVTAGRTANPVAFVFGSQDDSADADYQRALDIARDSDRAGNETPFIFDLREFDWGNPGNRLGFILDLVLFPADRNGSGVYESSYGPIYGAMLEYAGLRITLDEDGIPWGQETSPHRWMRVPTFEMPVGDEGWAKVPDALNQHLDRICPLPNKNGGQLPVTRSPGQQKSRKAAVTAA